MIYSKSKEFAVKVVRLYQYLCAEKHEYVLSKQVLRSGTSIGAKCAEASRAHSKAEFIAKMNISLKEACVALGFLTAEKFDEVFHPEEMV